jgi:hypothetical protein
MAKRMAQTILQRVGKVAVPVQSLHNDVLAQVGLHGIRS